MNNNTCDRCGREIGPATYVGTGGTDDMITFSICTTPVSIAIAVDVAEARSIAARLIKAADEIDKRNMTADDIAKETRERR